MAIWLLYLLLWISACSVKASSPLVNRTESVPPPSVWYYPQWYNRAGSSDDDPISGRKKVEFAVAYREAITLAWFAYQQLEFGPGNDPIFNRYFEPQDRGLVKEVYKTIAGEAYPDRNGGRGSPTVQQMAVYEGSSPFFPGVCETTIAYACINQNWLNPPIQLPGMPPDGAAISTCSTFYAMPFLFQRQCSEIYGDNDNLLMNSKGALLLHELVHWRTLTSMAGYPFRQYIQIRKNLDHIIDYTATPGGEFPNPPSGYNPYWAHQLVAHGNGDAAANADNYRWYALAKYWQRTCPTKNNGQGWGTAVDNRRPGPPPPPNCPDAYDAPIIDSDPSRNTD